MSEPNVTTLRHPAGKRELKLEFMLADQDRDGRIGFSEFVSLLQAWKRECPGRSYVSAFTKWIRIRMV